MKIRELRFTWPSLTLCTLCGHSFADAPSLLQHWQAEAGVIDNTVCADSQAWVQFTRQALAG